MSNEKHSARKDRKDTLTQFVVGVGGALFYAMMWFLWPKPHPRSVLARVPENAPGIVGWQFSLSNLLGNYYVQLAIFIVFVCLAFFRRQDRRAWIYAFLSAWGFAGLAIFHWLR